MRTYRDLKAAVADWIEREDLDGNIPEFVRMAEDDIYTDLRSRDNEFLYTITADLEADPVVDPVNPISLPDNFREVKLITVNDKPLDHISDYEYFTRVESNSDNIPDHAGYFTIIERQLYLHPWPSSTPTDWESTVVNILYYGTESLTDMIVWGTPTNPVESPSVEGTTDYDTQSDTNTTRLFRKFPRLFLSGALHYGYLYLREDAKAAVWGGKFAEALAKLRQESSRGEYSGSTVEVSSVY